MSHPFHGESHGVNNNMVIDPLDGFKQSVNFETKKEKKTLRQK